MNDSEGINMTDQNKGASESDVKLLKRYRKLFLFNRHQLDLSLDEKDGKGFNKMYFMQKYNMDMKSPTSEDLKDWFEKDDKGLFQSEGRLLVRRLEKSEAMDMIKDIADIEKKIVHKNDMAAGSLYHQHDVAGVLKKREGDVDPYASLRKVMRMYFRDRVVKNEGRRKKGLLEFMSWLERIANDSDNTADSTKYDLLYKQYMHFVLSNSEEMKRKMLNAYYSYVSEFEVSDKLVFVKGFGLPISYSEFRILAYLRNKRFKIKEFRTFLERLNTEDLENKMTIDYGLMSGLQMFVSNVCDPIWIDSLIVTHRITKSLWQNGSKFLNSYTLHNEEHALTLIGKSCELIRNIDYLRLKKVDFFILFLSCYLHDISMVIHPNLHEINYDTPDSKVLLTDMMNKVKEQYESRWGSEVKKKEEDAAPKDNGSDKSKGATTVKGAVKEDRRGNIYKETGLFMLDVFNKVYSHFEGIIRSNHPMDSAEFVRKRAGGLFSYLEPSLLSFVASVGESHGYDIHEVYGLKSKALNDTVSLKYIMMILRLADLHDVANDRINYQLLRENVEHLNATSRFHWISHLITDSIRLIPEYEPHYRYVRDKKGNVVVKGHILEVLRFELVLNVKCLSPLEQPTGFKKCRCVDSMEMRNGEGEELDCLNVRIGRKVCEKNECPTICRWVMKKHSWLVQELEALQTYLNQVNYAMFKTRIELNIRFKNEFNLDTDLYTDVMNYLEQS